MLENRGASYTRLFGGPQAGSSDRAEVWCALYTKCVVYKVIYGNQNINILDVYK